MRAANLMTGILNLAGMAGAIFGLSPAVCGIVADHFGTDAVCVYSAALAFGCVVNGLMAGDAFGRAAFGRDEDQ